MVDYYTPMVVVPSIPLDEISHFEKFLLMEFFDHEAGVDLIYLTSECGHYFTKEFKVEFINEKLYQDSKNSYVSDKFANTIASLYMAGKDEIEISFDEELLLDIFQSILKRSKTLNRIDIICSYVCSKMRPDGFGGKRLVITKDYVDEIDTNDYNGENDDSEKYKELYEESFEVAVNLIKMVQQMHKVMNSFAESVRLKHGKEYPWPEMDIINNVFEEAGLNKDIELRPYKKK